jgi:hypothetical protein
MEVYQHARANAHGHDERGQYSFCKRDHYVVAAFILSRYYI